MTDETLMHAVRAGDIAKLGLLFERHHAPLFDFLARMTGNTATAEAPSYVVPADQKWFAWLMVAAATADAMERLDLRFPVVKGKALAELERVREALAAAK